MSGVRITAEPRTEFGKGPSRRIRKANKVPVVLYGHGDAPRHFTLPGHDLMLALRHDPNALIALQTAEGEQLALPKAIVRDPIKGFLSHVDFVAVRTGEKVTVEVPVTLVGDAKGDVIVELQTTALSVEADATSLPESIEIDISKLAVGRPIAAADVKLPAGMTLMAAPELVIVQASGAPTAEEVEAELAESDAETGAGSTDTGADSDADIAAAEAERGRCRDRGLTASPQGVPAVADDVWLVVGLGNPGPAYAGNRHNAGFMVLDLLGERVGGRFKAHKGRADVVEGRLAGQRVVLAKPKCYMNESGGPVASVSGFFKVPVDRLVVVHDELDVDYGVLRLKQGGGDGGHNGLKSITRSLGSKEYLRVRFGIGRPPGRQDPADYVLKDFGTVERKELPFHVDRTADAVEALLTGTLEAAQNTFHGSAA